MRRSGGASKPLKPLRMRALCAVAIAASIDETIVRRGGYNEITIQARRAVLANACLRAYSKSMTAIGCATHVFGTTEHADGDPGSPERSARGLANKHKVRNTSPPPESGAEQPERCTGCIEFMCRGTGKAANNMPDQRAHVEPNTTRLTWKARSLHVARLARAPPGRLVGRSNAKWLHAEVFGGKLALASRRARRPTLLNRRDRKPSVLRPPPPQQAPAHDRKQTPPSVSSNRAGGSENKTAS